MTPPVLPDPHGLEDARRRVIVRRFFVKSFSIVLLLSPFLNLALWCSFAPRLARLVPPSSAVPVLVVTFVLAALAPWVCLFLLPLALDQPELRARQAICALLGFRVQSTWVSDGLLLLLLGAFFGGVVWLPGRLTRLLAVEDVWVLVVLGFFLLFHPAVALRLDPASVRRAAPISVFRLGWMLTFLALASRVDLGLLSFLFVGIEVALTLLIVAVDRWLDLGRPAPSWVPEGSIPWSHRITMLLDRGELDTAMQQLRVRLERGSLNGEVPDDLLARALALQGDPRLVHVLCVAAHHFPESAGTFLQLAQHAPDADTALAYAEFAEANALRSHLDPVHRPA